MAGKLHGVVGRVLALRAEDASSSRDEELEKLAPGGGGEGSDGWRGWKGEGKAQEPTSSPGQVVRVRSLGLGR